AVYNSQLSAQQVSQQWAAYHSSSGVAPTTTVAVTDPGGKQITERYDALNGNRLIAHTDGHTDRPGNTTRYGYDTSGFLNTVTDANGNVTTTGHDVRGNLVSQTTCQNQAASLCSTAYYTYFPDDTTAVLTTADPRNDLPLTMRDGRSSSATDNRYLTSHAHDRA